jgi:hypothetical protein
MQSPVPISRRRSVPPLLATFVAGLLAVGRLVTVGRAETVDPLVTIGRGSTLPLAGLTVAIDRCPVWSRATPTTSRPGRPASRLRCAMR